MTEYKLYIIYALPVDTQFFQLLPPEVFQQTLDSVNQIEAMRLETILDDL